jgi:poly-gamma-glutamate capsule biosynthesis protein CapA/YwtB (metallophosphatase superfamily)
MGLFLMLKPPGRVSSGAGGAACAQAVLGARTVKTAAAMAAAIMIAATLVLASQQGDDERSAELWLGGDVSLGDGGRGQLEGIARIVQGATGIVNLEGPVTERGQLKPRSLEVWNAPQSLSEIAALNVKVAGIANNHAADAGPRGPERSAETLRWHGLAPAGGPAGTTILHVNKITIAVTAHDLTHGVPMHLAAELKAARGQADVLIATFHVTGPPSYLPRPELRRAVEIAYQAGAQVIAAHGTHAVGPVERREHAAIAWGLGNVAFACDCTHETDAVLLRVRVAPGKAAEAEVIPIQAGVNRRPALPSKDAKGIFDLLEAIGSSKLKRNGDRASF